MRMKLFHAQTLDGPDEVTVRITGEVDLSCADLLAQALGAALACGRPVVADCAGVTFLDSTGLRALLETHDLAGKAHTRFRLASVSAPVQRVLELSGTEALFDTHAHPTPTAQHATGH